MKPRNKFEKEIVALSRTLPGLSEKQLLWAKKNCIDHIGRMTKKGVITCTECGHEWKDKNVKGKTTVCPHCSSKLQIEKSRVRKYDDSAYFAVFATCQNFQVIRHFCIEKRAKVGGYLANYTCEEIVQQWIAPNGRTATMARQRRSMFWNAWWDYSSILEIKKPYNSYYYGSRYNIRPYKIYPTRQLIPEIVRCGYKKDLLGLSPYDFFKFILSDSRNETLLKAGETGLLVYFSRQAQGRMDKYWPSIRICLRNHYQLREASLWCDYIDLLDFFGKDIRNPKYICPDDLRAAHNKYYRKKMEWNKREEYRKAVELAKNNEARYRQEKERFFGLEFSDGQLRVRVLESVDEIRQEGEALHHCVFTNEYYSKQDALILSATLDGQRIETIEVSLSTLTVVQSRGLLNDDSPHHKEIVDLVKRNIPLIAQRISA